MAVLALWRWSQLGGWRWLVLAGVLAGFFAGTKLPNPGTVAMLVMALGVSTWMRYGFKRSVTASVTVAGIAAAIFSIWMLRAWLEAGNPVYPYLPTLFGGRDLPDTSLFFQGVGGKYSVITSASDPLVTPGRFFAFRNPLMFLISPFTVTVDSVRFRGFPGPIFLAMLPAVLLTYRQLPTSVRALLWYVPFLYVGWYFSYPLLRNGLVVFTLLAVPTAAVFLELARRVTVGRWLMAGVLSLWLAFSLASSVVDAARAAPLAAGFMSQDEWLEWRLPMADVAFEAYPAYRFMNENLPEESKVLLWESRGYYLDVPYLRSLEFMYGLADIEALESPETVVQELQSWGITHVAMTDEPKRLWVRENLEATGQLDCVYEDDAMTVCALP